MSMIDNIRSTLVPIHKEGYPFIVIFFVISLLLGLIWTPLFWIGLILTVWCIYFFRDPERSTPQDSDLLISPADGTISSIKKVVPPKAFDLGSDELLRISIFMDVFSVHVNRAPIAGKIEKIIYNKGKFLNAELDKASEENENNAIIINSEHGKIAVVQVAGLLARRISCWVKEGDELEAGQRFGLIRFGSRVDLYLPETLLEQVDVDQKTIAGETLLAKVRTAAKELYFKKS